MTQEALTLWSLGFLAISSLAALAAVLVSLRQSRIAIAVARAGLYLEFSNRYNASEIHDAIIFLLDWRRRFGDGFAQEFKNRFHAREKDALEANIHRRNLNRYYLDVSKAYMAGVLDKRFARLAASHPGARVWVQCCVPMGAALYGRPPSNHLETLEHVVPGFGREELF